MAVKEADWMNTLVYADARAEGFLTSADRTLRYDSSDLPRGHGYDADDLHVPRSKR